MSRKTFKAGAVALAAAGLLAISGTAAADPFVGSFNTGAAADGVLTGIGGMDVYSLGSGAFYNLNTSSWVNSGAVGQVSAGDTVRSYYQGIVSVITPGVLAPNLTYPGSTAHLIPGNDYQITVAAWFDETVVSVVPNSPNLGQITATLAPTGAGKVSLFFDDLTAGGTKADIAAGTGFTDGTVINIGAIDALLSNADQTLTVATGSAHGQVTLIGAMLYSLIGSTSPDAIGWIPVGPDGYDATTTVQFGCNDCNDAKTSNFFDNANGWIPVAVPKELTVKADANISFTKAVPEPGSMALVGLSLLGLATVGTRKRRQR